MDAPQFDKTLTGYCLNWNGDTDIQIEVSHLEDDGKCELTVKSGNTILIPYTRDNILSARNMSLLAKRLNENRELDWTTALSYTTKLCIDSHRQGEPLQNADEEPEANSFEYLLWPILVRGQPTTIYSPGGYGKSTISDLMAVSITHGITVLDWKPRRGNVLILDWETDINIHRRYIAAIKKGLGITANLPIHYRFCENDLITHLEAIQKDVYDHKIDLVIIDSQMAATAHGRPGADGAQVAGMYYNALRTLKCTTLTIDHTSKQSMRDDDNAGPYGSVVKYNRSRSQFELKQQQEPGDNFIQVALRHQKFNLGRKMQPIGIQINFVNDENDHIDEINFENIEVSDEFGTSKTSLKDEVRAYLMDFGSASVNEITEAIDRNKGSVRTIIQRHNTIFGKDNNNNIVLL